MVKKLFGLVVKEPIFPKSRRVILDVKRPHCILVMLVIALKNWIKKGICIKKIDEIQKRKNPNILFI